jgi:hypothetical protein
MEKTAINETIVQLFKTFQEANQDMVDEIVVVQSGNVKMAQSFLTDWIETLKSQTEKAQSLMGEMEQLAYKEQEAFQKLSQRSVESSFDVLYASFFQTAPSLRLTESLRICLLALASRYPDHIIDINEQVLGPQSLGTSGWRASDLIELFQSTAPEVLQAQARLEVNSQGKGIYLLEQSEQTPALWIHCGDPGGRRPAYQGNVEARRQQHPHNQELK